MQIHEWIQLILLFVILGLLIKPIGIYLGQVLDPQEKTFLDPVLKPVERAIYRVSGIDSLIEHSWKSYLGALLFFSVVSCFLVFGLLACQHYLPLNPQHFSAPSWHLNFNTAVSFVTNTNWQNYGGESTLSYFSQMAALTVQNFASPAVGLAAAAALVRGLSRKTAETIGNFWVDLVRLILYFFLPLAIVAAACFMSEGVPQNFKPYVQAQTLDAGVQVIAQGPVASQEAIKMLGSNGGGFFNANSAHPYENPTPLTNFLQIILILLIPGSQFYYFGRAVRDTKHGWYILIALTILLLVGFGTCLGCEWAGNPLWSPFGLGGGNWEGKELRFGLFSSALFACATTSVSCGAVNCMHDSFTPIGGLIPMLNIQLSEVIYGGVGAGLYSVLLYVFLSIFIAGLIIGRTPEYLGKKIEAFEVKMTVLAVLSYVFLVHLFASWACVSDWGIKALGNTGPHGFSEILYAFSSAAANNGSAFGGLSGNTLPYNLTLGVAMLLGRFLFIAPVIAMAGSLAAKKIHPSNSGSFPVSSLIFISLLIGIILLQGALTFLPALTMGPILEQFFMLKGTQFP